MTETLYKHPLRVLGLLLCLLLQGCALSSMRLNELASDLETTPPEQVLTKLKTMDYSARDQVQYFLDFGVLKSLTGDFAGSIKDLQAAKKRINQLEAISISENLGAVTINDTLKSYVATPGEQVLLHELLIINYLLMGQLEAARVEVLQAQVKAKKFAETDELNGRLASMEYLAGFVYEQLGEVDNAMISYRHAANIMETKGMNIPTALQDSLLRCSKQLGLKKEYKNYAKSFGKQATFLSHNKAEVTIIYWDGVVSAKKQRFLSVYVPKLEHNVTLTLPYYPANNKRFTPLRFNINGEIINTDLIENIENIAREDLEAQSTAIYSTALARLVAKHMTIKYSQNQYNGNLTMLLNVASVFTEAADIRSWNMLPSTIQTARIQLSPGSYQLFPYHTSANDKQNKNSSLTDLFFTTVGLGIANSNQALSKNKENISSDRGVRLDEFVLDIKAGQKILLFVPKVSNRVYSAYL